MDPLHATIEEFAADGYTHVECFCPRCRVIRLRPISWLVLWIAAMLAGCATGSSDAVKEIEPGTYKIGVSSRNSVLFEGHDATDAAVEQAGQYCHSKGQKVFIVPTQGRDVTFRCGDAAKPG
jgi:hypothetical protein